MISQFAVHAACSVKGNAFLAPQITNIIGNNYKNDDHDDYVDLIKWQYNNRAQKEFTVHDAEKHTLSQQRMH